MTLSATWLRQAIEAAGISLAAPLAMLAVGLLLAAGGLGGLGSLGQLGAGPDLPGSDSRVADKAGDLAGASTGAAGSSALPAGAAGPGGASSGGGASGPSAQAPPTSGAPVPPSLPRTGTPQAEPVTPPSGGSGGKDDQPPNPGPVESVEQTARGLTQSLPAPVAPVTDDLLDALLGPPR